MMVLGALATTSVFGQNRHKPVVPPTPSGVKYKSYLTSYMKENSDFQDKMLFTLNSGLRNFQSETVVKREHLESVILYTRFVDTTITFFQNSFRLDSATGNILFYLQETYTGVVGVVNISGVSIVWIKKDCGNILICTPVRLQIATIPKPAPAPVPTPAPTPAPEPKPKTDDSEEEKRRQSEIQSIHLSQSQSFNHSRENSNEIESLEINEGAQFTLGVNGGGFNRNRQSDGRLGASCETSSSVQGGLAVGYKAPSSTRYYRNSSASSSNTSTSNSSSVSVNQGGNSRNQNQNQPAPEGRFAAKNRMIASGGSSAQGYNIATTAE